jgi:hypothetical protein
LVGLVVGDVHRDEPAVVQGRGGQQRLQRVPTKGETEARTMVRT